jgi:ATP-dependent Zn protease
MPNDSIRWSTAVHEAGHALVARGLGLSVGGLELFATEGAGMALIEDNPHLGIVDRIAICAAGMDATNLFRLNTSDQTGLSDEVQIYNLIVEYSPEDRERLRDEGYARARTILLEGQDQLRAVAAALASAGRLSAEEFASIV